MCTGSGAVAIALKTAIPALDIWAADISAEALDLAVSNAARLLPGRTIHFLQGDLFSGLTEFPRATADPAGKKYPLPAFSLIVSNPPYIPSADITGLAIEVQKEPRLALDGGADGLDLIRRLITDAKNYLAPGGRLLLEADPRQTGTIIGILGINGFKDLHVYNDLSGQKRVAGGSI
jgi:release factor glutamine methyltransferase